MLRIKGWKYLFTFGFTALVYKRAGRYRLIDAITREVILEY